MATKTAAKKKTTTTRAKSTTTAKRATTAKKPATKQLPISLHKEPNHSLVRTMHQPYVCYRHGHINLRSLI